MVRMRGKKAFGVGAAAVGIVVLAGAGTVVHMRDSADAQNVCALMSNTIGLYDGADVTVLGVKVGSVSSIVPQGGNTRVDMRVEGRRLPANTQAAVVSNSVVADRRVELVDATTSSGPQLDVSSCIPEQRTHVPVSVDESIKSFTQLISKLSVPDAAGKRPIESLLTSASDELDGLGPAIRGELESLARLMANPDNFMDQLGKLLDNTAEVTKPIADEWGTVKSVLLSMPGMDFISNLLKVADIVGLVVGAIEPLDRIFMKHLPAVLPLLEKSVPLLSVINSELRDSRELLAKVPSIVLMLGSTLGTNTGTVSIQYRSPRARVSTANSATTCAALNRLRRGSCIADGDRHATVPLAEVLLGAIGGRP